MPIGSIIMLAIFSIMFGGVGTVLFCIGIAVGHGITIVFGFIFALIGFTPAIIWVRRKLIKNYVMNKGVLIQADFLDYIHADYSIQGYVPILLRAEWVDEVNNLLYYFKSGPIDPTSHRRLSDGEKIGVYINPNNPKHYYIDMASAKVAF